MYQKVYSDTKFIRLITFDPGLVVSLLLEDYVNFTLKPFISLSKILHWDTAHKNLFRYLYWTKNISF